MRIPSFPHFHVYIFCSRAIHHSIDAILQGIRTFPAPVYFCSQVDDLLPRLQHFSQRGGYVAGWESQKSRIHLLSALQAPSCIHGKEHLPSSTIWCPH
jgi:hypothetical protein